MFTVLNSLSYKFYIMLEILAFFMGPGPLNRAYILFMIMAFRYLYKRKPIFDYLLIENIFFVEHIVLLKYR